MNWQVPRIWDEGDVWIIGGGPSVPRQFGIPDEVIQSVVKGQKPPSTYSPYMSFLHDKHVIGINVAYFLGDWIDMIFFGDSQFFTRHQMGLAKFPGLKVSCHPSIAKHSWIKYLPRDIKHPRGISESSKMVSWNQNSGSAAIGVAAHAGAKRIMLLGFDMCLSPDANQHWHDLYGRNVNKNDKNRQRHMPFQRHLRGFAEIAKDAKRMGIEIVNVCPESAIPQFRKTSMKEFL